MRILSWNVNSLRSRILNKECGKLGEKVHIDTKSNPYFKNMDIICLQETKLWKDHEPMLIFEGYYNI